MNSNTSEIAGNAVTVGGATLLSRILGFVRDLIVAFALGAGPLADAFFVAFRLPNLLRRLFAEGSLTMAFVPVFTRIRHDQGMDEAQRMARSTLFWLVLILGGITAAALIWARPLTLIVAPGFAQDPAVLDSAVHLVRICFPYILFISAVALSMGVLNSMGHFLAPALAPCFLNLSMILASLIGVWAGLSVPVCLAWGVLAAGVVQWLIQLPALHARGIVWRGEWSPSHPGVRRVGRLMLPTVFGAAVYQLNVVLNTVLASFLVQGSISYLYYADRLVQFPLGVFGLAVSTAALPSLSSLLAREQRVEFVRTLQTTVNLLLFISLPAAAGLIGLSLPMVDVLFGRGAFDPGAVQATSAALIGYSLGLPAFCAVRSLVSALYALEDTRSPVWAAVVSLGINLGLGLLLMQFIAHVGLAVAVSLASWANVLLLGRALNRHVGRWFGLQPGLLWMTGLSVVLGLACSLAASWGWPSLACIPLFAGAYMTAARMLHLPEAEMILSTLGRKLGKGSR
ncbi:murein biosynthesis integral membrane protein MurJ [Desulfovermiculus halophilus]|uniref:murein biosynthesis integral membrane protein MurJ n=1 Tax=Desulfovermiculus halophilus TaxID=339722 RepID=UPI0004870A08|nr:murein biosynthesis integral membrane protein MurJ [Desulfovermiculus halophilus]